MEPIDPLDIRRLRGLLAEARVTHTEYAQACRLSRSYVSGLLCGFWTPGELATIKMRRGLVALGLDEREVVQHAAS